MATSLVLQILASALQVDVDSVIPSANFTSHGGDSIAALRFSMECRRRGIFVPVDAALSSPSIEHLLQKVRLLPDACATCIANGEPGEIGQIVNSRLIRPNKSAPKDSGYSSPSENTEPRCRQRPASTARRVEQSALPHSHRTGHDKLVPVAMDKEDLCSPGGLERELSDIQLSLVHGSMDSAGANIIYYAETHRPGNVVRLRNAWKQVCRAEPIFSTTYRSPEDGQVMHPQLHWREFTTSSWKVYQNALLAAAGPDLPWSDNTKAVDFALRFTAIHYDAPSPDDSQTTIIWAVHHALIDGWSAGLLVRKAHLVASGETVPPGPSYVDLLEAQKQYSLSHKAEGDLFWAQQQAKLATACEELLLEKPDADTNTADLSSNGGRDEQRIDIALSTDDYASIKAAAQRCGVTPAAFFYAAWAICLGLYSDSDNVVVGAVVSTRNLGLPGIFDVIGPMVNTLPLQVDLSWEISARDFVTDVFDRMQRLLRHSWTTLDNGFTRVKGNLMAMTPNEQRWAEDSIGQPFYQHTTNLPLSAIVKDDGSGMVLQYSVQAYSRSAMETLAGIFKASLLSLCSLEDTLDSARLLPSGYVHTLSSMGNWNSRATTVQSITDDLVTLFERAAAHYPSAVAIECGEQQVSYAELGRLSGMVAHKLASRIGPEEVVAVHADGSINWIISIYGILRAGGTYCPLDKAHPQHYRDALFESSTARVFLATNAESMSKTCSTAEIALNVEAILSDRNLISSDACFPARVKPRPQDRAYLCFTSGSTGKPKGVMCMHQGLVSFQNDLEVRLGALPGTRIAQVMSVAFDGAIHELFSAISYGATLVLRRKGEEAGLSHLGTVDCAILTPSLASALDPDDFPRLKTVYMVGEIVPQTVCDIWAAKKTVFNMYGPTEATCGATIKRLRPGHPVTIGGPNPSTRIYVLDSHQRLAPPGRVGEIYLAGVQVARGYIGQPRITEERFLPDPFCGEGEFMYRTGDRGYWSKDGDIIFLGRADRQIKLRGFRIDLEDLEARVLRACSKQYGACAVAITNRLDDLVCMIQTASADLTGMQNAIRQALPAFAVPRYVLVADNLPMTPNMKVDYRSIANAADGVAAVEPLHRVGKPLALETETEIALAAIWSQVLDAAATAPIGPESNFLHLGGHSLMQMKLAAKLRVVFGAYITMRMILTSPTLRELATAIDNMTKAPISPSLHHSSFPSSEHSIQLESFEASPMEKEWWQKYELRRGTSSFNVSWVAHYDAAAINRSRMVEAWNMVLARHDIFRSRYMQDPQCGLRRVLVQTSPRVERRRRLDVRKEVNRMFNLASAPPVRVTMTHDTIVAVWSHIICDYTALSTILNEVAAVYHRNSPLLPPLQQQFGCKLASSGVADPACLDFWSTYLGNTKHIRHSYLGNCAERTSYDGSSLAGLVSTSLWHQMQRHVQKSGLTLQQLLVAAVAAALTAKDDKVDLTLGMPFINRHSEAEMEAVGLFLEPLPVRVSHYDAASSVESYLATVQSSSQRALAHAVPWNQLLKHLDVDASAQFPNHPLFDCVASFHDARGHDASQPNRERGGPWSKTAWGAGMEPQLVWSDGAKFKLMVECVAYDEDTLVLRLEYDPTCFGSEDNEDDGRIEAVRRMILTAMEAVVSPQKCTFGELRQELTTRWRAQKCSGFKTGHEVDMELLEGRKDLFLECFSKLSPIAKH